MSTRITVEQLEHMKTHELAELLANVVLVLRRMPDVECRELMQQAAPKDSFVPVEEVQTPSPQVSFTYEELDKKTVPQLKKIAKDLHLTLPTKVSKKAEIIHWLLERTTNGHSEQYAIQNV
jgi:hypothetical protein